MLKLFVGRREIYDELRNVYADVSERIKQSVSDSNTVRIYGYEALSPILACDERVDIERFEDMSRETLDYLNNISLNDIKLSFQCTFAVGAFYTKITH